MVKSEESSFLAVLLLVSEASGWKKELDTGKERKKINWNSVALHVLLLLSKDKLKCASASIPVSRCICP